MWYTVQLSERKTIDVQSDLSLFYTISGAPGTAIKPPTKKDVKVFVQSTSQGSRCLKKGTSLLYKVLQERNFLYASKVY